MVLKNTYAIFDLMKNIYIPNEVIESVIDYEWNA